MARAGPHLSPFFELKGPGGRVNTNRAATPRGQRGCAEGAGGARGQRAGDRRQQSKKAAEEDQDHDQERAGAAPVLILFLILILILFLSFLSPVFCRLLCALCPLDTGGRAGYTTLTFV